MVSSSVVIGDMTLALIFFFSVIGRTYPFGQWQLEALFMSVPPYYVTDTGEVSYASVF